MEITIHGAVGLVFSYGVVVLSVTIMFVGIWVVANYVLFEHLLPAVLRYFKVYHRLILFIWAYERLQARKRRAKQWQKFPN